MENFKYALFYADNEKKYYIRKVDIARGLVDDRILYVFDLNKLGLAKKIQSNMNRAKNSLANTLMGQLSV